MRSLRAWFIRFANLFRRTRHEQELADEIESNLQLQIEDNIRAGMSPEDARRAARRKFGSIDGAKEACRDRWGIPLLENLFRDAAYTVRILSQNKGWTFVAVLSLGLGIGANTAIFSAVNGLLLKTLPVDDPHRLVRLKWAGPNDMATESGDYGYSGPDAAGRDVHGSSSYPMYEALLKSNRTLEDILAFSPVGNLNVVADGHAGAAWGLVASGNFFKVLGLRPALGRVFTVDDDEPSAPPVAVISHAYWARRFGNDPAVVGKVVTVTGVPVTIIGVMPAEFSGVNRLGDPSPPEIMSPLAHESQFSLRNRSRLTEPSNWWLYLMGRLKPGVRAEQVQGNLNGVFQQAARVGWNSYFKGLSAEGQARNANRTAVPELHVDSGSRGLYDISPDTTRSMIILSAVSGLVLLIVCANVANLLLSRAAARQREMSVRLSLGATRPRLIGQLLTESVLLAFAGGGAGILIAYWGRQLLPAEAGQPSGLDWRVFVFAVALSVAAGIIFGLAPAFRTTALNLAASLKENSRNSSRSRTILSKSLIVLQVAVSLILLVGAGLLLRSLDNLRHTAVGFNPQNILLFRLNPLLNRYDQTRAAVLHSRVTEELRAIPGVRSVSTSDLWLLSGAEVIYGISVHGRQAILNEDARVHLIRVAPDFFKTMEIALLAGRDFTELDNRGATRVAIINESAARKFFSGGNPIGRAMDLESNRNIEVVGVVADAKFANVRDAAPPTVYVSFLQWRIASMNFEVRTAGDPTAMIPQVEEAIRRIDPNLLVMDKSTQAAQLEERFSQERFFALSYSLFGLLAATLASIGLFGVMSYNVARRTNEIGIRIALGAGRGGLIRMVLKESLGLVGLGLAIGVAGALTASRLIASLLFGIAAMDAPTFAMATVLMILVSVAACWVPARKASRVDPMVALRYE